VSFGLGGVGVDLFVGVDHPVVGDTKAVDVGGDSPVIELSSSLLNKGVRAGASGEKVQQPPRKGLDR
jgi:hypothetical protein